MTTARRHRERLLLPVLVVLGAIGALILVVHREHSIARERVRYEDVALTAVHAIAQAELAYHERKGRYGWLSELQQAGLLEGSGIRIEQGADDPHVASGRYRIDVLLPFAVVPGDLVRIAPRSASRRNPDLERSHFVVTARPWGDALTGFRTFYLDEAGDVLVSEGVSDIESRTRRHLPEVHLTRSLPRLTHGLHREFKNLRWYRLDELPPR